MPKTWAQLRPVVASIGVAVRHSPAAAGSSVRSSPDPADSAEAAADAAMRKLLLQVVGLCFPPGLLLLADLLLHALYVIGQHALPPCAEGSLVWCCAADFYCLA